MVSNYMATIIVLTFSIPGIRKMAISQKLLDQMSSNFRIGNFKECGTFGDKMKPIQNQRAWAGPLGDLTWNNPKSQIDFIVFFIEKLALLKTKI